MPLSSPNKRHYTELLLLYYRLFMQYLGGVEREVVVSSFEEYFLTAGKVDAEEREDLRGVEADATESLPRGIPPAGQEPRPLANLFLRKLIGYGWMSEEERLDFSRVINLSSYAKPFFEALEKVSQGLAVEYESHIVAVYSSLCGDAVKENGHHAVLNAHYHTRLLVESLKILEQNIRGFIQGLYQEDMEIPEILHAHYDVYMNKVVDNAYTRLKTSDNLSRYRPKITAAVAGFLNDGRWLTKTASKLSIIKRVSLEEAKGQLKGMLMDVREDLKSIDPLLEDIDDKNRRYSRISTERIKAKLYNDSTLYGKASAIIKTWRGAEDLPSGCGFESLGHTIIRDRYINAGSLYTRKAREISADAMERPKDADFDAELAETEIRLRLRKQLNPAKISEFLTAFCPEPGVAIPAEKMVSDMESFVKVIYAALYAESRTARFPFHISWKDEMITKGRFKFREHSFIRRYPDG